MNDTLENRRLMDRYLDTRFDGLEKTLDRVDKNQSKLFEKYDTLSVDVAALIENKKERNRKSGAWGAVSGGVAAVILFMVKWFMEE